MSSKQSGHSVYNWNTLVASGEEDLSSAKRGGDNDQEEKEQRGRPEKKKDSTSPGGGGVHKAVEGRGERIERATRLLLVPQT